MGAPLLEIEGLRIAIRGDGREKEIVRDATLVVHDGEVVGLLGASGCGKTTMAAAILGLLPAQLRIEGGSIRFRGQELAGLDEREYEKIRGGRISLIFQEAALALNPVLRVREQVAEVARAHNQDWSTGRCREHADACLAEVALDGAMGNAYPHQLSGGQRQRAVIAQALCCRPELVIADEPTASLDTTTQAEILALMKRLQAKAGIAMLFISHNPAVLLGIASRVAVMHEGSIVEQGAVREVFLRPQHPRTRVLLESLPKAARVGMHSAASHAG